MTKPKRYLRRMTLFVALVAALAAGLVVPLKDAFLANIVINGVIIGTLLIGIVFIFRQVLMLKGEIAWVDNFRQRDKPAPESVARPVLLAPMAALLEGEDTAMKLSSLSMRSLLDSIASRLDEGRDISRYLIGLLIFLGLLGTFWGLLSTIGAIGDTINSLTVGTGDLNLMFDDLKAGLGAPLAGMGTAFSSSLFGLAGSVILGFLDLQAGQAQNRFYNDLEEWLSTQTRLTRASAAIVESEGDAAPVSAYLTAVLEQSTDGIEKLQRTIRRSEESRSETNAAILALSERLAELADKQEKLGTGLEKMLAGTEAGSALDDASKTHLRNMDVHLKMMLESENKGRDRLVEDLRGEFKMLARTIAALVEDKAARSGSGDDDGGSDGDGGGLIRVKPRARTRE